MVAINTVTEAALLDAHPDEESRNTKQDTIVGNGFLKKGRSKRKPNYATIHKDPLPLEVHPWPTFHPTNPISVLHLLWTCLKHLAYPPSSHPTESYMGYLSAETRSVHVTDPKHIRALWERGFFGKGTLSRSEPSWMDRERARLVARSHGGQTAEEATKARREGRRLFKLERARLERDRIEQQRLLEQGEVSIAQLITDSDATARQTVGSSADIVSSTRIQLAAENGSRRFVDEMTSNDVEPVAINVATATDEELQIRDQEHLQLTLEEAFFLKYALGVLDIRQDVTSKLIATNRELFNSCRKAAAFEPNVMHGMDDQFILNYVVYHHFRSLGWVVRPGVKFSVDFLLYNRGPVFSHAEFAILIMPSYSHNFWSTHEGKALRKLKDDKDWWWLHCINRVQSQVKKTLVLCYVDIPPPVDIDNLTIGQLLSRYQIREFIVRRWLMNRSRD